jgi:NAD(P)-dependent dehydrogenase (short-subunit alcohol dehydrogenase family)
MQEVVNQTYRKYGGINGVIHLAGVTEDSVFLSDLSLADCQRQFHAKVYGTMVLEKVLGGIDIDFCLLGSSISSVLGGLGMTAYSAANLFMDSFARRRNQREGRKWLSVNWDAWRFDETESTEQFGETIADLGLTPDEGIEAFRRVFFRTELDQVIVATGDLDARIAQWSRLDEAGQKNQAKRGQPDQPRPRMLASEFVAPRDDVERTIAKMWEEMLGVEQVGVFDNFFELGGDSLLAVHLFSQVRAIFQVNVKMQSLFESPNVAGLAGAIQQAAASGVKQASPRLVRASRDAYRVDVSSRGAMSLPEAMKQES